MSKTDKVLSIICLGFAILNSIMIGKDFGVSFIVNFIALPFTGFLFGLLIGAIPIPGSKYAQRALTASLTITMIILFFSAIIIYNISNYGGNMWA